MRKKLLFLTITLVVSMFLIPVVHAQEVPSYEMITDVKSGIAVEFFFANGTPITISERTDGVAGALITWDGGSQLVSANANVFGAGHDTDTRYETTNITMYGGAVRNVIGGGLHKSNVGTSNIVIYDGQIMAIDGGGASSLIRDTDAPTYYAGDPQNSPTRVDYANVTVYAGGRNSYAASYNLVYGGGEGINYTGFATVTVNGGTWDYVIAGGNNGYTGSANMKVTGGEIAVLQSVNRGSMNKADITITGGTITNAYVGGEPDNNVTGTIDNANMTITGGTVTNVAVGTNGGKNNSAKDIATLTYNEDAVKNIDISTFDQDNIVSTVTLIIDVMGVTETVEVPKDAILTTEEIEELENLDLESLGITGYHFGGYYQDATFTTKYDFSKAFDQNTVIYMKLDEIKKPDPISNPDTGDMNVFLISGLAILGLIGTFYLTKKTYCKYH